MLYYSKPIQGVLWFEYVPKDSCVGTFIHIMAILGGVLEPLKGIWEGLGNVVK
jgi:hypothetical protein